jgi:hypothetical protein
MPWNGLGGSSGAGGGTGPGTGTPGSGGSSKQAFTYTQSTAAKVWTFVHDLDFEPGGMRISDFDSPDASWIVPVAYDESAKRFTLTFPIAVRGDVTVS